MSQKLVPGRTYSLLGRAIKVKRVSGKKRVVWFVPANAWNAMEESLPLDVFRRRLVKPEGVST